MGWIFAGVVGFSLLVWYLYRRSQNETAEDTEPQPDETENIDDYEDLLLTGIMLSEIYDDDNDASDDTDSDGYDDGFGGGYDDDNGFE